MLRYATEAAAPGTGVGAEDDDDPQPAIATTTLRLATIPIVVDHPRHRLTVCFTSLHTPRATMKITHIALGAHTLTLNGHASGATMTGAVVGRTLPPAGSAVTITWRTPRRLSPIATDARPSLGTSNSA